MDSSLAAWLQLALVNGIGSVAFRTLLDSFGDPARVLASSERDLTSVVGSKLASAIRGGVDPAVIERSLAWAAGAGCALVILRDERYSQLLLNIADPPPLLYARGDLSLANHASIAVVGSRNPSPQGIDNAYRFARALSDAGLTVVSGLASGVDAAAHQGALDGGSNTIAVLGTGIDVRYPRGNAALAERIETTGLVLSEFPLGTPAIPGNFPRRNRVISGLSVGCLVVEAGLASGSLITARLAADQGREVFAIPGSIHSPMSKGCHALIKQGAKLVETAQDVLDELRLPTSPRERPPLRASDGLGAVESALEKAMGHDPVYLDILCARLSLTPDVVSAMLLELEVAGKVTSLPGGRYQRG